MKKSVIIVLVSLVILIGLAWEFEFRSAKLTSPNLTGLKKASAAGKQNTYQPTASELQPQGSYTVNEPDNQSTQQTSAAQTQNPYNANPVLMKRAEELKARILSNKAVTPPPKGATMAQRQAWYTQMLKNEPFFQFKMPISFWGKVVDDNQNPISDATVVIVITKVNGTEEHKLPTDSNGMFSLTDQIGARLSVDVSKEGYKPYKTKNRYMFDYDHVLQEDNYEPDPENPIVFYLRKDQSAEPLIRIEKAIPVQINKPIILDLSNGKLRGGQSRVILELLENHGPRDLAWSAQVTVPDGGIQANTEEFPFLASNDGYQASLLIGKDTPKPPKWPEDYWGGQFYVKTPAGYARLSLRMLPGATQLRITSFFNPSGSTNLEYDPAVQNNLR